MQAKYLPSTGLSPRRWHPAPAIVCSALLHVASIIAVLIVPSAWQWVLAIVIANHLVLISATLFTRSQILGPNMVQLPIAAISRNEVCLTFDDGPDPVVTPQVLDILDRYNARASFFCIGERAAVYPHLVKEIVRRGHSVENHSHHHSGVFSFFGPSKLRREVESTQATICGLTGQSPAFFRAPAGFRNPFLDPVLARCGLHYVSWTRRGYDAVHRDSLVVSQRLIRGLAAGDVLLLHDGGAARTRSGRPVVLAVLPMLLQALAEHHLHAVTLRAACHDNAISTFDLKHATSVY